MIPPRAVHRSARFPYSRFCSETPSGFLRSTGPFSHWSPQSRVVSSSIYSELRDSTSPQVWRPIITGLCVYSNKTGNWQTVVRLLKALPRNRAAYNTHSAKQTHTHSRQEKDSTQHRLEDESLKVLPCRHDILKLWTKIERMNLTFKQLIKKMLQNWQHSKCIWTF